MVVLFMPMEHIQYLGRLTFRTLHDKSTFFLNFTVTKNRIQSMNNTLVDVQLAEKSYIEN